MLYQLFFQTFLNGQTTTANNGDQCCKKRTVSGKGDGIDGIYFLQENLPATKPHENCADNCLYSKLDEPGENFCFQEVDLADAANVVCEAISSTELTTITTLLSTVTSMLSTSQPQSTLQASTTQPQSTPSQQASTSQPQSTPSPQASTTGLQTATSQSTPHTVNTSTVLPTTLSSIGQSSSTTFPSSTSIGKIFSSEYIKTLYLKLYQF